MWVESLRPHVGGVSLWRYALNFLAVFVAALLCAIILSPATHAADITWEKDTGNLKYGDKTYQGPQTADGTTPPGMPDGAQYFEYIDTATNKSRMIYFDKDADLKTATNAKFAEYDYDQGATQKYANRSGDRTVTVEKQPAGTGEKEETSCTVGGIGYIVCPIMNMLAEAMDKMFDILRNFLEVKPLSTDRESGLYKAWAYMLALANVLFVAGFLVIIYSYVSNQGVKQYDLRTIIPRLIVAAVLINASYYICAIAVDASNIFGANLQDVFNTIRKELATTDQSVTGTTWTSMTTYILSGGTILAGLGAGLSTLGALGAGAVHLLMPILVSSVIAILVVVVVLAIRQALITVLIILAPLAFAAFILPSTQKYFDKWKDLFMTMLIMYPMFSILFGGSQLAASLVAQNATSILVILFAMFIQVAPLILTPFLIKFSGSLLGKVAGIVNNPAKGLGDRAKNWSKNQADMAKQDRITRGAFGSGIARSLDNVKRKDEARKKRYESLRNAQFNESKAGRRLAIDQKRADDRLARADKINDAVYEGLKRTNADVRIDAVKLKIAEMSLESNKAKMDTYLKELESEKGAAYYAAGGAKAQSMLGSSARDVAAASFGSAMHHLAEEHMAIASRQSMADSVHRSEYADQVLKNKALAEMAGGIKGETGANLALANATQTIRKDFGEGVNAQAELMKHFSRGLGNKQVEKLAYGLGAVVGRDSQGREYTFDTHAEIGGELHEAAAAKFMKESSASDFEKFMIHVSSQQQTHAGESWSSLNSTVKEAAQSFTAKLPYVASASLDLIDQGKAMSNNIAGANEGITKMIIQTIEGGKLSPEKLAGAHPSAIKQMIETLKGYNSGDRSIMRHVTRGPEFAAEMSKLAENAAKALADDRIKGSIDPSVEAALNELKNL